MRIWLSLCALGLSLPLAGSQLKDRVDALSRIEMQSVIEILSHDLFEGRAPGTRGGELAELYCRSLFKWMGLQPGWHGDYLQPFAMKAFTTSELTARATDLDLNYLEDIVGNCQLAQDQFSVEGELVFAGFGIRSDIWQWDDFKNADLRGKILVVRVNDPGSVDPERFEGRTMTYFGRWTYKIEAARAMGARAVLIIHTDASAGYGWPVVRNSWSGEQLYLPDSLKGPLQFSGWIREASLRRLLTGRGIDLDRLYAASQRQDFQPVPLGIRMRIDGKSRRREVQASNVVARIPGRSTEQIVLIAHIDHLGINPTLTGDQIMNGAIDNGSAVAALMLSARILSECRDQLRHSITLLACQGEEEGLLGSTHYVANTDRSEIVAAINFESSPVWEDSASLMGVGARFSTIQDMLVEIAREQGVQYREFSLNDRGFFFRSDQYPFASRNIPAVWISAGEESVGGKNNLRDFFDGDYHSARDEYRPDWNLGALRQTVRYALMLVEKIDQSAEAPRWKRRLTFPTVP